MAKERACGRNPNWHEDEMPSDLHRVLVAKARDQRDLLERELQPFASELCLRISEELDGNDGRDRGVTKDFLQDWWGLASAKDAIEFFLDKFPLKGASSRSCDFPVKRGMKDYQEFLQDIGPQIDRPVVYVAWKQKPFEVFYVGKAAVRGGTRGAVKRLTDSRQKQLLQALFSSSTFSLLYPSRFDRLDQLEASTIELLRVVDDFKSLPGLNRRREVDALPRCAEILRYERAVTAIKRLLMSLCG